MDRFSRLTRADHVAEAGNGGEVIGRASLGDAVANAETEILLVAEAIDIGLRWATKGGSLAKHVGHTNPLFLMSVAVLLSRSSQRVRHWGSLERRSTYTTRWDAIEHAQVLRNSEASEEHGGNGKGLHLC